MSVEIGAGYTGTAYPLSTPRIGYKKISGTVLASTEAAGYAKENAATDRTDSFWRPTAMPASWRVDTAGAVSANYCGIAAHNLGTQGATVLIESSPDGTTWTTRVTHVPTDDSAILALFATVTVGYWRVRFTGSNVPTVAVIRFGMVTEFPLACTYAPSISFERTKQTTFASNITEGGQWAGRTVVRKSLAPVMSVSYLSETWIASDWDALALAAETVPLFIADRPGSFPKSVAYAFTTADLRAERQIANAAVANSVNLELVGFLS